MPRTVVYVSTRVARRAARVSATTAAAVWLPFLLPLRWSGSRRSPTRPKPRAAATRVTGAVGNADTFAQESRLFWNELKSLEVNS